MYTDRYHFRGYQVMLKYVVTILLFFTIDIAFSQAVTAKLKMPKEAVPGGDYMVEVTITKGSINDFIKFDQTLPADFIASEVNSNGGTFTFIDNQVKLIWLFPPAQNEYTFSYKVTVPKNASGIKNISSKVYYLFNMKREIFDLENISLSLGNSAENPSATDTTKTANPITATTTSVIAETNKTSETSTQAENNTPPKPVTPPAIVNKTTPVISKAPSSVSKSYRVQIGAYTTNPKITGVPELSKVRVDGITKYLSGNFGTYEEALKRKKEMFAKGYHDAFIVTFENGKIVK